VVSACIAKGRRVYYPLTIDANIGYGTAFRIEPVSDEAEQGTWPLCFQGPGETGFTWLGTGCGGTLDESREA
jgi:hypothetical protein